MLIMKAQVSFYKCELCGNMVGMIKNAGGQLVCCGKPMTKLEANTTEASQEKHIPMVNIDNEKIAVQVGSVPHPMVPGHSIEWIALVSDSGTERVSLSMSDEPKATFYYRKNADIYAYCNLHGLWKVELI